MKRFLTLTPRGSLTFNAVAAAVQVGIAVREGGWWALLYVALAIYFTRQAIVAAEKVFDRAIELNLSIKGVEEPLDVVVERPIGGAASRAERFAATGDTDVLLEGLALREEIKAALEGDSNDAEHDALVSVAAALGIEYHDPDDVLNDEEES